MFDFSRTFRGVNANLFFNFSDIFLISPTSDPSDFLLNRAVRAVSKIYTIDIYFLHFWPRFFSKDHVHYRHELVFFWRFSRPKGDAHNVTLNTVAFFLIKTKKCCYSYLSLLHESTFFVCMWTLLLFLMSVHTFIRFSLVWGYKI